MRNLVCAVVMETATKEAVMQALSTNFDWMVMLKLWLKQAIKDRHDSVLDSVLTVLNKQPAPPTDIIKRTKIGVVVGSISRQFKKSSTAHVSDGLLLVVVAARTRARGAHTVVPPPAVRDIADALIKKWSSNEPRPKPKPTVKADVSTAKKATRGTLGCCRVHFPTPRMA